MMRWAMFHLSCVVLVTLLGLNSSQAQTLSNCQPPPPMRPNVKPGVVGFDLSRDGRTLLVASGDGMIRFVDMTSGHMLRTFMGHTNAVYRAIFSPDEKLIGSSSRDLTARVWDWGSGRELWKATGFRCAVKAVVFSPDGRLLAAAGNDGLVTNVQPWGCPTNLGANCSLDLARNVFRSTDHFRDLLDHFPAPSDLCAQLE